MLGYILFLVLGLIFTAIANAIYGYQNSLFPIWYPFIAVFVNFLIILGLDAIIAFVIHKLPASLFDANRKIYKVSKRERNFLVKLGVKKWKDLVPDFGQLCNFKKGKVESKELDYLNKFLVETCYAEVIHIGMILIGFLDLVIWSRFSITIPLVIINFCLNFPPILIQRYNRPRLQVMYNYELSHKKVSE